jgi:membrane-associated HD superfamily phosphohydrolase
MLKGKRVFAIILALVFLFSVTVSPISASTDRTVKETSTEKTKEGRVEQLQEKIEKVNEKIEAVKERVKDEIEKRKEKVEKLREEMNKIRERYSDKELEMLRETAKELKEKIKDIKVLPVEKLIIKGKNLKFDTPPVIKGERTLIPVRALTEGFGATVTWNGEEKTVTISKDNNLIVLNVDSNKIYVNGEEKEIDVPAQIMNGRTVVPIRFIVENLGLKVKWDAEEETIEIEDSADPTDEDADDDSTEDTVTDEVYDSPDDDEAVTE